MNAELFDRRQRAQRAGYDAVGDSQQYPANSCIEEAVETATRVRITPEVTKAFLRFAHPAPLEPNIRLALVAAFEAAGFEVED